MVIVNLWGKRTQIKQDKWRRGIGTNWNRIKFADRPINLLHLCKASILYHPQSFQGTNKCILRF